MSKLNDLTLQEIQAIVDDAPEHTVRVAIINGSDYRYLDENNLLIAGQPPSTGLLHTYDIYSIDEIREHNAQPITTVDTLTLEQAQRVLDNAPNDATRVYFNREKGLACYALNSGVLCKGEKDPLSTFDSPEWYLFWLTDIDRRLDDLCRRAPEQPPEEKAMRFNTGKPELSYLLDAPVAVKGLAEVFAMGAEKYERDNWKKGLDKDQIIDSLLRHLLAFKNGEQIDPESQKSHTFHVLWNALVLAEQHSGEK